MGFRKREPKTSPTEEANEVEVEVDLLTGATRVDPRKLLSSKATRDLLARVECVEKRIMQDRAR